MTKIRYTTMILEKKNIILVGMTGVGKTTVGRSLSKILRRSFIDIDLEIEKSSGLRVSDIFQRYGEFFVLKLFLLQSRCLQMSFSEFLIKLFQLLFYQHQSFLPVLFFFSLKSLHFILISKMMYSLYN